MNMQLKRYGALLFRYLRPQWRRALVLALLVVANIALQLFSPQLLRTFIDSALAGGVTSGLIGLALTFLAVGFSQQIFSVLATYIGTDVGWTATNKLRVDLAEHCLALDMGFHNERTPGELIERIDGDITALSNFFSQFVIKIAGSVLMIGGILVVLTIENRLLGLVLAGYAILSLFALNASREIAVKATAEERESTAALFGFVEERLAGIDDIRANGGGAFTLRRFYELSQHLLTAGRRAWIRHSLMWVIVVGLFTVGDLLSLGFGIYLFGQHLITIGTVYLFFQYTQIMADFVDELTHQLQDMQKAGASIGRVQELLSTTNRMVDGEGTAIPDGPLGVEFEQLTFAYGDATILKNLSFSLRPGTVLGLLGRTGSGKTTLTRMLFRLYDPVSGSIRISGVDLRETRLEHVRQRIAMVTQEVQLFHASVRDNLTFFNRDVTDQRILAVIEELGLDEWFRALPNGLDTMLGAGGSGISAGEAQLLAFVRVFLRNPGLVILDEPSSRMDLATERLLERAMHRLLKGRTAIIIAHRLSTVRRADEIMILDHGTIQEHGNRAGLADDPSSRFSALLQTGMEHMAA
ncbi:MAG TPA: ABC transporter ATP-binding protein [Candidatus Kapabacteria bacterium]|nr:ABC transporter ATP-binding protein [Candidatus Kapabacteria bacterium]